MLNYTHTFTQLIISYKWAKVHVSYAIHNFSYNWAKVHYRIIYEISVHFTLYLSNIDGL